MKLGLIILLLSFNILAHSSQYEKQLILELAQEASGYSLTLPKDIYQQVYHANLADIRIINATGNYVPMRIFLTGDEIKHEYTETSLPIFELNETTTTPINTKQVRTTNKGTFEDYTVTTSKTMQHYLQSQEKPSDKTIIIDASTLAEKNIKSLEIDWQYQKQGNRIFTVNLSASNNLINWSSIKNQQKLLEINTGTRTILENSININNKPYAYYRLTFMDSVIPNISRIRAQLINKSTSHNLQIQNIKNYTAINNNQILFDTGGYFPVESFTFGFDQKNIITDVKLYSRQNSKKKWQYIGIDTIYNMRTEEINSIKNSISVRRSNHRYWKIELDENISNQSLASIKMAWRNHQIEFLAQGDAPFTLIYAKSGKVKPVSTSWYNKIPSKLKTNMFSTQVSLLEINAEQIQIIDDKVQSQVYDYSRWIFWLILSLVILILSFMAYKLVGETNTE